MNESTQGSLFESDKTVVSTFDQYEIWARSTAIFTDKPRLDCSDGRRLALYPFIKLAGETGEVMEKIGKLARGDNPAAIGNEAIAAELGDVLWYLAACAGELGISLQDIAALNVAKIEGRRNRGTVRGDGDDR